MDMIFTKTNLLIKEIYSALNRLRADWGSTEAAIFTRREVFSKISQIDLLFVLISVQVMENLLPTHSWNEKL